MRDTFVVKDSGAREEFTSGMVRDTADGKVKYTLVLNGPMLERWAVHLTKGEAKYPPDPDGTANWTKASGIRELLRFRESALRHLVQWLCGDTDEDHAAAVFFNVNGHEYVKSRMRESGGGPCIVEGLP